MSKATAFAPPLIAFLLGCSALSNPASAGWFDSDSKPAAPAPASSPAPAPAPKKDSKPAPVPAVTLDDSIREAQMLRLAGNYQDALNHLSQLMLVAADDGHVISEYGKTLVSMGRADEAEKFLTRAQELQSDDWTIYSALGVAYDEIGNQKAAQASYEHALVLRPGEPSVLNNYALSRMLAKDPDMARKLADRAETANGPAKDDKIARNIAMIRSMAPSEAVATNTPAPGTIVPPMTAPAQHAPVTTATLAPVKTAAPGVVMQPVPVDPLAGPVSPRTAAATHEPRSLQSKTPVETPVTVAAKTEAPKADLPKTDLPKIGAEPAKPVWKPAAVAQAKPVVAAPKPAAIAQAKPVLPVQKPQAVATVANKPAAVAAQAKPVVTAAKVTLPLKAADVKPAQTAVVKAAEAKPVAAKVSLPVKAADVKPAIAQPAVVKAADAKPQDGKAKPAAKDAIPGLRMSANAY